MAPFTFKTVCLFLALVALPQVLAGPACTSSTHGMPDKSGSETNGINPYDVLPTSHDLNKTSTPYPASVPTDTSPSSPSESPPLTTGSIQRPSGHPGKHEKPYKSGSETNVTNPYDVLPTSHDLYKTSTPYPASVPTDTSPSSPSESPPPATRSIHRHSGFPSDSTPSGTHTPPGFPSDSTPSSIPTPPGLPSDSTPSSTPTPSSPEVPAEEPSPTTSSVEPSTPESSPTPSTSDGDDFKATALDKHNSFRALHGASPLTWNETLAATAQESAERCTWEHMGGPYGENYAGGGTLNITNAIDMWGGEQDEYQPGKDTGLHFSQVVWKSTKELGCASVTCPGSLVGLPEGNNSTLIACEYYPPGNYDGQFEENVQV